jgi:RNA polymerase sigma-70 factor (ECF subfamily)
MEGPGPFENAVEREQAGQLYQWVDQLDEETRETMHLHYYQGLSINETAEALNIATSTVKYRLRAALDFLRTKTAEPKMPLK